MKHEGNLLVLGRHTDLRSSRSPYLTNQVTIGTVADNGNGYTLRLTTCTDGVDLAVVAITECAVVGCRQITYRVLLMTCDLLFLFTVHAATVDVRCAVFLTQIVKATAIGFPYRVTVFTAEVRQFSVGSLGE